MSAALVLVGIAGAPPARADDPGVQIAVTSMSPAVWAGGSQLTITGSVTNSTSGDIAGARVVLWQSQTALTSLDDLQSALTQPDVTQPRGSTVRGSSASQALGTTGALPAGQTSDFTVTGALTLQTPGSAYLVGVQVQDARGNVLARARLPLSYPAADPATQPVASALVVPLTTRPSLITPATASTPAVFGDDHLAGDLAGTLGDLITLAGRPGVTALIDPALVQALTAMAAGYQVLGSDGQTTPGTGQSAAKAALTSIDAVAGDGAAYRLPFNNPDLSAAAELSQPSVVMTPAVTPADDDPLADLPLALWAPGPLTPDAEHVAAAAKASVLVSSGLTTSSTLQRDSSGSLWVAATPVAAIANLAGPSPDFAGAATMLPPLVRQAYFTIADATGNPRVLVAADDASATTLSSWMDQGWQPEALAQAVDGRAEASLAWDNAQTPSAAPADLVASTEQAGQQLATWGDLSDTVPQAADASRQLLTGALSTTWQGDWSSAASWLTQGAATVAQQVTSGSVHLQVAASWHLSSADNPMPISIVNTMAMPVKVKVTFASENPARLSVPDTDVVTVDADSTSLVIATPQPAGNGSVEVSVRLVTESGTVLDSSNVQVMTTSAGRLGWIIIFGSGIAFVIATSLRVRQVRHQRRAQRATATDDQAQ